MKQESSRAYRDTDADALWQMLEPVFRAGETYAIDSGISRQAGLAYWLAGRAYVAEVDGSLAGSFYIQENRPGGGAHYCNCGFVTAQSAAGTGVARAMLEDALARARTLGFLGMVFNFVVATNTRAIDIWQRAGFDVVGRVPGAFQPPSGGAVDALVMYRSLE